jgi:hypothetical protein
VPVGLAELAQGLGGVLGHAASACRGGRAPRDQGRQPTGPLAQHPVQTAGSGGRDRGHEGLADRLVPDLPPAGTRAAYASVEGAETAFRVVARQTPGCVQASL